MINTLQLATISYNNWLVIILNERALDKILEIAFLPSHLNLVSPGRAELTVDPNFQMVGYQAFELIGKQSRIFRLWFRDTFVVSNYIAII